MKDITLVLGASLNPERSAFHTLERLAAAKIRTIAIGLKEGNVAGIPLIKENPMTDEVETVTLYLNAARQKPFYEYILSLHPRRIIFNPGAENPELAQLATDAGIESLFACTRTMLSVGTY